MAGYFLLFSLNNLVETTKKVVIDVEEKFDAPLLLVCKHRLNQLVRLVDYSVQRKFAEGELLALHERLHDDNGVLVQVGVVYLVKVCDCLKHAFLWNLLVFFS